MWLCLKYSNEKGQMHEKLSINEHDSDLKPQTRNPRAFVTSNFSRLQPAANHLVFQ